MHTNTLTHTHTKDITVAYRGGKLKALGDLCQ